MKNERAMWTLRRAAAFSAAALMAAMLTVGCSDKKADEEKGAEPAETKTSQVAAKVNGSEITVRQIDAQMPNLPADANPEMVAELRNAVLNRLINDQLIVDKALADKLDRKPEVADQLERAKRAVLARAYIQQLIGGASEPTEMEIKEFFDKSAAEFSGNVRYIVRQMAIEIPANNAEAVRDRIVKATSVADLTKWLSQNEVRTVQQSAVIDSARLNPQMRDQLKSMKAGDILREVGDNRARITEILRVEPFPLSMAAVRPLAERDLTEKRRTEILESQIKQMRDSANIEFMGGYAKPKSPEEMRALVERLQAEARAHEASPTAPESVEGVVSESGSIPASEPAPAP